MTSKILRIGTRDSVLATWQARYVADILKNKGCYTELKFVKTQGDRVLDTPLPLMGGKGVFTRALDEALLGGEIDLAVHSFKDIPTRLPEGLKIGAVTRREDPSDVFVIRKKGVPDSDMTERLFSPDYQAVIASSSHRRAGQWLARYPHHRFTDIRGNIQTRLKKLEESDWDGGIFAAAGLKRLGLEHHIGFVLDWMLPAPAQGAMAVMVREDQPEVLKVARMVHDPVTALCTTIEREVLHLLEGGCSAPVGALAATDHQNAVCLKVNMVYPDGTGLIRFELREKEAQAEELAKRAAEEAMRRGAGALIKYLRTTSEGSDKKNEGHGNKS